MFSNTVKELKRLRKEISRLLRKGISNIYLKLQLKKTDALKTSIFLSLKNLPPGQFLGSSNSCRYLNSCRYYNSKIRGLEAKLCVAFLLL